MRSAGIWWRVEPVPVGVAVEIIARLDRGVSASEVQPHGGIWPRVPRAQPGARPWAARANGRQCEQAVSQRSRPRRSISTCKGLLLVFSGARRRRCEQQPADDQASPPTGVQRAERARRAQGRAYRLPQNSSTSDHQFSAAAARQRPTSMLRSARPTPRARGPWKELVAHGSLPQLQALGRQLPLQCVGAEGAAARWRAPAARPATRERAGAIHRAADRGTA